MATHSCLAVLDDATVRGVAERIRNVVDPDRIILFGSAVTGPWTADSDIDLLVLLKQPQDEEARLGAWVGRSELILFIKLGQYPNGKELSAHER